MNVVEIHSNLQFFTIAMDTLTSFYNSVRTKVNPTLSADEVIEKYGFEREEPALAKKKNTHRDWFNI